MSMTEYRFYRDAHHPEMIFEIRTKLEDRGMNIDFTERVADLMNATGWQVDHAIDKLESLISVLAKEKELR